MKLTLGNGNYILFEPPTNSCCEYADLFVCGHFPKDTDIPLTVQYVDIWSEFESFLKRFDTFQNLDHEIVAEKFVPDFHNLNESDEKVVQSCGLYMTFPDNKETFVILFNEHNGFYEYDFEIKVLDLNITGTL